MFVDFLSSKFVVWAVVSEGRSNKIQRSLGYHYPGKMNLNFSKFPEGGLILVIIALGLLLAVFGGSVQLPKFQTTPDGKRERVFETNAAGQKVPAFETVNKFFNARTIVQIAKDTSFFAIMAVGMTVVIITGGIDLSIGSMYALASVCGALVLSPYGPSGGGGATILGVVVTIAIGAFLGFLNGAMITAFRVHPFIITLGTMAIYRGIAFVQTGGQSIGGFPEGFRQFVRSELLPDLSLVPLVVMILVTVVGGIFLAQTAIGRKSAHRVHHRRACGNRATAQIVAVGKSAGHHHEVGPLGQRRLGMPDHRRFMV